MNTKTLSKGVLNYGGLQDGFLWILELLQKACINAHIVYMTKYLFIYFYCTTCRRIFKRILYYIICDGSSFAVKEYEKIKES